MKILYLLKQDAGETAQALMAIHRMSHEVVVVDIRSEKNYPGILEMIEQSDRVISW